MCLIYVHARYIGKKEENVCAELVHANVRCRLFTVKGFIQFIIVVHLS